MELGKVEDLLDALQIGLGIIGLLPIIGNIADAANGGVSVARGNYTVVLMDLTAAIPGPTGILSVE